MTLFQEVNIRNWYVRVFANELSDHISAYLKGEKLIYFRAVLKLIATDPDGFANCGFDFMNIRFYDHERKGKKLVSVKAQYRA